MDYLYGVTNYSFFDSYWAAIHFGSGLLIGLLIILIFRMVDKKRYFGFGMSLLVFWEIFEFFIRILNEYFPKSAEKLTFIPETMFQSESIINILSDLILGYIGLAIIYWIFVRQSGLDPDNTEYYDKSKDKTPPPRNAPPDIRTTE